jgi:hypothetical protein
MFFRSWFFVLRSWFLVLVSPARLERLREEPGAGHVPGETSRLVEWMSKKIDEFHFVM